MIRHSLAISLAASVALTAASSAHAVEIRLCEREIRTAPLSDERGVQSALVQGFAVVNTDDHPVTLTSISFHLNDQRHLRDLRWLLPPDIALAVKQSPQISMIAEVFPSQFCNGRMLMKAKLATSDTLAPGEAVVFMYQPFAWKGVRDELEIVVETKSEAGNKQDRIALSITSGVSKTRALYPVPGRSFVAVAASFHTPHRWASIEEFAYDIAALTANGSTYRGKGTKLSDYAAFGMPVRAVADGKVVAAIGTGTDNAAMLKRPDEAEEAYFARLQQGQMELLAEGMTSVLGNYVVIDHGNGEFSISAHLKQGSVRVKAGDTVRAGEPIGAIGSSGNSTEPHLHFQICDAPDIVACRPVPANFTGYRLPLELAPRIIQSGDIVEAAE